MRIALKDCSLLINLLTTLKDRVHKLDHEILQYYINLLSKVEVQRISAQDTRSSVAATMLDELQYQNLFKTKSINKSQVVSILCQLNVIHARLQSFQLQNKMDDYWLTCKPELKESEEMSQLFINVLLTAVDNFIKEEFLLANKPFAEFFAEFEDHFQNKGLKNLTYSDYRQRLAMTASTDLLFFCMKPQDYMVYRQFVTMLQKMQQCPKRSTNKRWLVEIGNYLHTGLRCDMDATKFFPATTSQDAATLWKLQKVSTLYQDQEIRNQTELKYLQLLNQLFSKILTQLQHMNYQALHHQFTIAAPEPPITYKTHV